MSNEAKDEFGEIIDSVTIRFVARLAEETKVHAASSSVAVKGEVKSIAPPCLGFGCESRNLGVAAKKEQPPVAKMDLRTDSVMAEKGNPTQPPKTYQNPTQQLKTDQKQTQPPKTYPNPTQQLKTEQNQTQQLKTEQ